MDDNSPTEAADAVAQSEAPALLTGRAAEIDALLRAWTVDCLHNSPVSRDVEVMNHITIIALPDLARRLLAAS